MMNRTLSNASRGRTLITVTHRLRSIVDADRIFVLDAGRLVEQGRHEDLLRQGGVYADIWRKQHGLLIAGDGTTASVTAERLRLTALFRDLDPLLLEDMSHRFASEPVPADRLVLQEGDPGDRFYIIARGRVEVSKGDASDGARTVAVLETGDHFGEIALLRDVPRTATVRTLTPCIFLTLQRAQFLELIARIPGLARALEQVEVRRAALESADLTAGSASSRGPLRRAFDTTLSSRFR